MDVTWSPVPGPSTPRGRLTSAPLLSSPLGPDVCFFTPLLSPDFLGLLSHDCTLAPSDRRCQLAVRHSGGSSWVNSLCTENGSLRQTHIHSISLSFVYAHRRKAIKKYGYENRQGDIYYLLWTSCKHNLWQTVYCERHQELMKDPSGDTPLSGCP